VRPKRHCDTLVQADIVDFISSARSKLLVPIGMIMAIYGWYIDAAVMKESVINFYKKTENEYNISNDRDMEHCLGNQNAAIRVLVNDDATMVE
jgi:hypothetical protein